MKDKKMSKIVSDAKSDIKRTVKVLGPVSDLERHLPSEWWKTLFNSLYLKTDGDVVENHKNTEFDINLLIESTGIKKQDDLLDVCCGQGRHSLELAKRGYHNIQGIDRSRYLIKLARKRAKKTNLYIQFSEGDARKMKFPKNSRDCIFLMGNSFGYFEREEDDMDVLKCCMKILKSKGKLVLDIVDGKWMKENFEPRSWEWIDQFHFVNRERSLSQDGRRIITREVITHSDIGVIADQFYAERLYLLGEITEILENIGFENINCKGTVKSSSTRGQDLGMMAHRLFLVCKAPVKHVEKVKTKKTQELTVLMGDPTLPDTVKLGGKFNNEDMETISRLKNSLRHLKNFKINYLDNHNTMIKKLIQQPPKLVFNLCDEGYQNDALKELHIPALLEMLNIPYTGAGPGCLSLCYNKSKVRSIAMGIEIPVPLETLFNSDDQAANIPAAFPALLKPALGDSSIGITQKAVVNNGKELVEYLNYLKDSFPKSSILVQEFLSGREFSVGLIGNPPNLEVLPILEVNYQKLPKNLPQILSYESKWQPDSPYWKYISYHEANIDEEFANRLYNYSKTLFEFLECRDYARIDFRCDQNGETKLLEVNPNPGWCWDGKFNLMAGFAGISYSELLQKIILAAMERLQQ